MKLDLQKSDSAPGRHSSVLCSAVDIVKDQGWTCSLSSKSEGNTTHRGGKLWSEYCSMTAGFNSAMSGTLFCNPPAQPTSIFLGVSRRGQLKSQSISQFGLAPHFRQVPVGIYNTFRTRSSLSAALTLNASTTYLTDIFFPPYVISQTVAYSKPNNALFKIA